MRKISSLALAKTMAGLLLVSALGGGTAYAASTVAHNGLLDQQEAETFAYMDADVKAEEVTNVRTRLERDNGVYVYDIEFYVGSIEYEYEIRAEDGMVLEKDKEDKSRPEKAGTDAGRNSQAAPEKAPSTEKTVENKEGAAADNKYISVDRAKQIALEDAGLKEEDVKFTTAKFEDDNGRKEYDVEFYSGSHEYEYEIDAMTGEILDSDVENEDD